jgi:protein-disulfide isomerase
LGAPLEEKESTGIKLLLMGLGMGLILGGVIGYLYANVTSTITNTGTQPALQTKPPTITNPPSQEKSINMVEMIDDDPWAGSRDAKVIIVEFSDFQCPFCAQSLPTVTQIKETYGDRVLFVYRDFPLSSIHPEAQKAGEAAQCAFEQDAFWPYHDLIFEKQSDWGGVGTPKFKEYSSELGLDTEKFNDCLDSGKYADEVADDLRAGQELGVTGTPTFFINGKKIVGAQPFQVFQTAIEDELA